MSRIHRRVPPKGSKIGIAFSGGLDTRCAVAWLARKGLDVFAYTADLAQPDEETPSDIPPVPVVPEGSTPQPRSESVTAHSAAERKISVKRPSSIGGQRMADRALQSPCRDLPVSRL